MKDIKTRRSYQYTSRPRRQIQAGPSPYLLAHRAAAVAAGADPAMSITPLRRLYTFCRDRKGDLRMTDEMWRAGELFERARREGLPLPPAHLKAIRMEPSTRKVTTTPSPEPWDPEEEIEDQQGYLKMVRALKDISRTTYDETFNVCIMHRPPAVLTKPEVRWRERDLSQVRKICAGLRALAAIPVVGVIIQLEQMESKL